MAFGGVGLALAGLHLKCMSMGKLFILTKN